MQIHRTALDGVLIIEPRRFGDARGWFAETFRKEALAEHGFTDEFIQDNHSLSAQPGTVRGLHFQIPPFAQAKLVRCTRGRILDIAVDIRQGSSTLGRHVAVELGAEDGRQLLVPAGFAHGFCTLEADCEVQYKVTSYYSGECERGILWNDPQIGIDWPVGADEVVLSAKDRELPRLAELPSFFTLD